MDKGLFREFVQEKDLTESERLLSATCEMLKCLGGSPYRRMILISLLDGEKNIYDIKNDIKRMSACAPKATNNAFEFLKRNGFLGESSGKIKLTDKGKDILEIFKISLKIYGNGKGTQ